MTGVLSCANNPIDLHVPLTIPNNCIIDKYTDEEIDSMTGEVGRKTYRNHMACVVRHARIKAIIKAHNDLHGEK